MSLLLILLLVVSVVYFLQTKYRIFLVGRKFPGPWALPLVGNVQMMAKIKPEFIFLSITEIRRRFQKTYRLWLGTQLWIFLHSPEETRDVLNDSTLVRADAFNQLNALIGNGLLISHGKLWDLHRRALGPAFHPNVLNSFVEAIDLHAEKFIGNLQARENQTIEASECLFPCILDIIFDTSMGKKLNAQDDSDCVYTHAFHNVSKLLFKRMVNPLLAYDFIFKLTKSHRILEDALKCIHNLMEQVIQERSEFLKQCSKDEVQTQDINMRPKRQSSTFLDRMLTTELNGRPWTYQEIRDEVNTFVLAGVDTTTAAMSFVFYALAKYPETQRKLYEEIKDLVSSIKLSTSLAEFSSSTSDNSSLPLSIEEINRLKYLDMFIKECLRFYTIVPLTGRQTTTDTKIGDVHYCAGITIWVNIYGLAHDETYFEQPEEFRPERFSCEKQKELPPFSYIPFSGGHHVCIGRKYALLIMKILTVKVIRNFELSLNKPDEELILLAEMVLKSLNGINLRVKSRK